MSHDDRQTPTDQDERDQDTREATEELTDDALDGVSGGNMPVRNYTSPFGDQS
jgi:hypothetical protein